MNDEFDKIWDEIDHHLASKPDKTFIQKIQSKALSFAEEHARISKNILLIIATIVLIFVLINSLAVKNIQKKNTNTDKKEQTDYTPVKGITYE